MRILYFTDCHLQSTNPVSRTDNYFEAILTKLSEIATVATEQRVDCMICGGDFFSTPSPKPEIIIRVIDCFKDCDVPGYAILGNHDMFGQQLLTSSSGTRMVNLLPYIDKYPFKLIDSQETAEEVKEDLFRKYNVQIDFQSYYHGIEDALKKYKHSNSDCYRILVAHANIINKPALFPHVVYSQLSLPYDVVLCSHYHDAWGIETVWNVADKQAKGPGVSTTYVSPGAMARISAAIGDINRVASYVILDISDSGGVKIKIHPLECAKPGTEIFNLTSISETKVMASKLESFITTLAAGSNKLRESDPVMMLREFAKEHNIPDNVVEIAVSALEEHTNG